MQDNLRYFKESIQVPEIHFDKNYMSLEVDVDLEKYKTTTKQIKELLTTIKVLKEKNKIDNSLYDDLYNLTISKFGSKNEFNCFINACDTTSDMINNNKKIFKGVVDLYIKNREISEHTPKEWIQSLIDKGASRKHGSSGENKLINIAKNCGYKQVYSWDEFNKETKVVAKFSKNTFDIGNIKRFLDVSLELNSQNKMLDLIIKNDEKIMFLEAKHPKESGGSQDKQIKELIDIIQKDLKNYNIYLSAFLDGIYSNEILNISDNQIKNPQKLTGKGTKINNQQYDLITALKSNKNNFWLNTAGFEKFIQEF